jgi:hypothetical protein
MGGFLKYLLNETKAKMDIKMDTFMQAYVEAALWSSTDDNDDALDKNYSVSDIAEDTLDQMRADCEKFKKENEVLYDKGGWDDEQAGHDFWLTRNGHGAGFWDRAGKFDKEVGEKLTKAAKEYGTVDLIVGDDGKIHG